MVYLSFMNFLIFCTKLKIDGQIQTENIFEYLKYETVSNIYTIERSRNLKK